MRVALLGLGLIGGSIARALREGTSEAGPFGGGDLEIAAWTPSSLGPRAAHETGVVDQVARTVAEAVDGVEAVTEESRGLWQNLCSLFGSKSEADADAE